MIKLVSEVNGKRVTVSIDEFNSMNVVIKSKVKPEKIDNYTHEWRRNTINKLVEIGITDANINEILSGRFDFNKSALIEYCREHCLRFDLIYNVLRRNESNTK